MIKIKIILFLTIVSILASQNVRYIDEVFEEVVKTEDVIYGNAPDLPFFFLFDEVIGSNFVEHTRNMSSTTPSPLAKNSAEMMLTFWAANAPVRQDANLC